MSSTSPFDASLLQAIDDVMSLALYPQVISLAPQHFRTSETQVTCDGKLQALVYDIFLEEGAGKRCSECVVMVALPASLSARSFLFTPACPGQYTHRSFRRWWKVLRLSSIVIRNTFDLYNRAQELCKSPSCRHGLPVPNSLSGLCGHKVRTPGQVQGSTPIGVFEGGGMYFV